MNQHTDPLQNLIKIEEHAKQNSITIQEACLALGYSKNYYYTIKSRHKEALNAFKDFCEAKGLDYNDVNHGWYKGEHIGKDKISLHLKANKEKEQIEYINQETLTSLSSLAPIPTPFIPQHSYKENIILELNLYDCHFGKRDFLTDEGTKETAERFKTSIHKFVEFTLFNYKIKGITIAIGNDLFNVDNIQHTTTRGTPQDQEMPFEKMFIFVQKLVVESLLYLSKIAPLDVVMVRGNHDYSSVFMLGQVLEAYFSNHHDVHVDNGLGRKIRFFGNTAVGFAHGEKDIMKTPSLIYTEFLDDLFKYKEQTGIKPKYFEWHCGHWHGAKVKEQEQNGIITRFFGALSVNDRWHYNEGYIGNRVSASAIIHNLADNTKVTKTITF